MFSLLLFAVALAAVHADGNGTYTNPTIHYNTPDPGALWDPETGLYWVSQAANGVSIRAGSKRFWQEEQRRAA